MDRLVALRPAQGAGDPVWWVLDYKLHGDPLRVPAYRAQLARYVAAVQALQAGQAVQGAFITGQGRLQPLDTT